MNIETNETCPSCRKPLPQESSHSVCPACMMAQAMVSRTQNTGDTGNWEAPSPEELDSKFPQFEITECLGRGGMGVVYKGRQKSLDRWVAIKILPPGLDENHFAERFAKEAKTLARMSHQNIVTVYDHGEADGLFYIVMEYVDGVNLRDLLQDEKLEAKQALAIIPPVCEALEYAHGKGVVHRDIKPENILLDRLGRIKIADFGIASLVGATGERSGTPPYMAPEQKELSHTDERADIYALGVVLYEMLTGERPDALLTTPPSGKVEIDVRIDEIVLRALEKEPEQRYQSAAEFRTVVETVTQSERPEKPSDLKDKDKDEFSTKKKPRFSRMATIIGSCLFALIGIALIGAVLIAALIISYNTLQQPGKPIVAHKQEDLEAISNRSRLPGNGPEEVVDMSGLRLTQEDISQIAGKPHLKRLTLQDSNIKDGDLRQLTHLKELSRVSLAATLSNSAYKPKITDVGFDAIARWSNLQTLNLSGNPVTDEGLKHLTHLEHLRSLQLGGTKVRGKGLIGLRQLDWLRLDATPIQDEDLQYIARLSKLEQLYLDGTDISDAGLEHLTALKRLRVLNLHGTKVTAQGIEKLKASMPKISVGWDNSKEQVKPDTLQLSNGTILEIIAVTRNPRAPNIQWWRPDGTLFKKPPVTILSLPESQPIGSENSTIHAENECFIYYELRGPDGETSFPERRRLTWTPRPVYLRGKGSPAVSLPSGGKPRHTVAHFALPESIDKINLTADFVFPDAPWEKVASYDGKETKEELGGVMAVFSPPRYDAKAKRHIIDVMHNISRDHHFLRLVAYLEGGEKEIIDFHSGVLRGSPTKGYALIHDHDFDIKNVQKYVLERTPRVGGEIRNIVVNPQLLRSQEN